MTSLTNYISRLYLILLVSAVSIGSTSGQPAGRLIVLRAPNFGWDLAVHLEIDGRSVATIVRGRHYDGWVPAGRHVLTVYKVPYIGRAWPTSTTVNVQPGWTYVFTALWDSNLVFLHRSAVPLSPGEEWQLPKWPK